MATQFIMDIVTLSRPIRFAPYKQVHTRHRGSREILNRIPPQIEPKLSFDKTHIIMAFELHQLDVTSSSNFPSLTGMSPNA